MRGDCDHPLDDICGSGPCECEFGYDPDDQEPEELQHHFWRRCWNCDHVACAYLHCPHDGIQSSCVNCGARLARRVARKETT